MGNTASTTTSTVLPTAQLAEESGLPEEETRSKLAEVYNFVATYEETRQTFNPDKAAPSFIKEQDTENEVEEQEDWDNHFLGSNQDGIIFSSYQIEDWENEFHEIPVLVYKEPHIVVDPEDANEKSDRRFWLKLTNPSFIKAPKKGYVFDYLQNLLQQNSDKLEDCKSVPDLLSSMSPGDLPVTGVPEDVRSFCHRYWAAQKCKPAFETLYDCWGGKIDMDSTELVVGFGHVRQNFNVKRKKESIRKHINSPLVEVVVNVDKISDGSLVLSPVNGARVKMNLEAKNVLVSVGGGNKKVSAALNELVATGCPTKIFPGDPVTYQRYLEKAKEMCWNADLKAIHDADPSVHELPDDPNAMVLTYGWCLYLRPKRSTICSEDAHAIKNDINSGHLSISKPLSALVHGSKNFIKNRTGEEFPYPLPASPTQKAVIMKVFEEQHPNLVVQGPFGTGKTQTGVNIALVALSKGKTALITSLTAKALQASFQKIPEPLRMFSFDLSGYSEGRTDDLCRQLECMQLDLSELLGKRDEYEEKVQCLEKQLSEKKEDLSQIEARLQSESEVKKNIFANQTFMDFVLRLLKLQEGDSASPILLSILRNSNVDADFFKLLVALMEDTKQVLEFDFDGGYDDISDELLKYVKEQATPDTLSSSQIRAASARRQLVAPSSNAVAPPKHIQSQLAKIMVGKDGRSPITAEDYTRVARGLEVKKDIHKFKSRQPESSQGDVSLENQKAIIDSLLDANANRTHQRRHQEMSMEIQELETNLVHWKIFLQQSKSFSQADLSKLNQLTQAALKLKASSSPASKKSSSSKKRGNSQHEAFIKAFRECMGFIRLVLMTTKHVCEFVPRDCRFGYSIIDEASQLDCTAFNLLARADQVVTIGDHKQHSPLEHKWTPESEKALEACEPDIASVKRENSFFESCKTAYAESSAILMDQFRCPAESVAWNNWVYHNRINTYKPSGGLASKIHIHVEGGQWDRQDKVNQVEAQATADFVKDKIQKAADRHSPVWTILVIAMTGKKQAELIQKYLEEPLKALELPPYDNDTVDRHNIIITGESKEYQGTERDLVVISAGHSSNCIPAETDFERTQLWNTATSRHQKQLVLIHSFGPKDVQKDDPRRKLLENFIASDRSSKAIEREEGAQILVLTEKKLSSCLEKHGYQVRRNVGNVWGEAFSVSRKPGGAACALVCVENYGESAREWKTMVEQQCTLEGAGTPCLRIDALSLAVTFNSAVKDVLVFLDEALPHISIPKKSTTANLSSSRSEDAIEVSSSSDSDSAHSNMQAPKHDKSSSPRGGEKKSFSKETKKRAANSSSGNTKAPKRKKGAGKGSSAK